MKYKRLLAEMFVNDVTQKDLAVLLDVKENEVDEKITGDSDFYLNEVLIIMDTYFGNETIDYVFSY